MTETDEYPEPRGWEDIPNITVAGISFPLGFWTGVAACIAVTHLL